MLTVTRSYLKSWVLFIDRRPFIFHLIFPIMASSRKSYFTQYLPREEQTFFDDTPPCIVSSTDKLEDLHSTSARVQLRKIARSRRELKTQLRLRRAKSKAKRMLSTIEPLKLGRRIVLRNNVRIPVESLTKLHKVYQEAALFLNVYLAITLSGDATEEENIIKTNGLKNLFDEYIIKYHCFRV